MFFKIKLFLTIFIVLASIAPIDIMAIEKTTPAQKSSAKSPESDKMKRVKPVLSATPAKTSVRLPAREHGHSIRIQLENAAAKPNSPWYKDILPVITLVLGLLLKELIDSLGNIKRTKKIGKRWKTELEILSKPLGRQVEEIKKSIEHHKTYYNEPPKMVSIASLECENFESLDKSELLNYINRYYLKDYKEAVALAGQINLQISIIKSNSDTLQETFKNGLQDLNKRNDKLNANFQELIQAFHVYQNALNNTGGEEALNGDKFKVIGTLFVEQILPHMADGKFDYRVLARDYFAPMIKELDRLSANPDTHQMASYTRKCLDNAVGIRVESGYLTTNLANLMGYFQQSKTDLENLLNSFDPKKRRFRLL